MNPFMKAMDEIRFQIPEQIIQSVFVAQELIGCGAAFNTESMIRASVIEPRVLVDLDLHTGSDVFLSLGSPVRSENVDPFSMIYHIPEEVTQNRPITQAYSIHFGILGYQHAGMAMVHSEGTMSSEIRKVLDAAMRTPPASTSYLNLIAHNTVMVRFVYMPYANAFMRCRLGHDEFLSTIRTPAIPAFAKLCVLAVKAFIYNKMILTIGQAFLSGGQAFGEYQSTIERWQDAEQMYQDALQEFKGMWIYVDPEAKRRYLRSLVGGGF